MARPTVYTEEMGDLVCMAVAASTKGLKAICEDHPEFPRQPVIYEWLAQNVTFASKYADARARQMELMGEELVEIADDSSGDVIEGERGPVPNAEFIARSRLRVDTRKWLMSKLAPKKYGEKLGVEMGCAVTFQTMAQLDEAIAQRQAELAAARLAIAEHRARDGEVIPPSRAGE